MGSLKHLALSTFQATKVTLKPAENGPTFYSSSYSANNNDAKMNDGNHAEKEEEDEILAKDTKLKSCLLHLLHHEWPFSWIKGHSAFIEIMEREMGSELALKLNQISNDSDTPFFCVSFGKKVSLNQSKIKKDTVINFIGNMGGSQQFKLPGDAINFEDKAKDIFEIEVYKNETRVGSALIPLKEAENNQMQKWHIKDAEDRNVGSFEAKLAFVNDGKPSKKAEAQRVIQDYLLGIIQKLYKGKFEIEGEQMAMPRSKTQYMVVIKEERLHHHSRQTKTQVSVLGDRNTVKASETLPDGIGKEVFLPIKDLTTEKLELKVHIRKGSGAKRKLDFNSKAFKPLGSMTDLLSAAINNNLNDSVSNNEMQISLSELPLGTWRTFEWGDELKWHIRITAQTSVLGFEQLKALQFWADFRKSKEVDLDTAPLLHFLRPFYSPEDWKLAQLNSRLKLFKPENESRDGERDILARFQGCQSFRKLDPGPLKRFSEYCLNVICAFNAGKLMDEGKGKLRSPLDAAIDRVSLMIEAANAIFSALDLDMNEALKQAMLSSCTREFQMPLEPFAHRLDRLMLTIESLGVRTIDTIIKRFSNFGLTVWCPILAECILQASLATCKSLIEEASHLQDNDLHFHETFYNVFKKLKFLEKYLDQDCPLLYETFTPCLDKWAQCVEMKARNQVKNLLDLTRKDHKPKCSPEVNGKKLRFIGSRKKMSDLRVIPWNIEDSDKENWKSGALNAYGIFHTCHKTWEELAWPDLTQSIQYGNTLFKNLTKVYQDFIKGLHDIIMDDEYFDHIELVLALICLHKSFRYTNLFNESIKGILKLMADKNIEKDEGKISEFFNLLADSREDLDEKSCLLVTRFCTQQRQIFRNFIDKNKLCHISDVDEHIYSQVTNFFDEENQDEADNLLGYMNALLKFLHLSLEIDDENMKVYYKNMAKSQLFDILEEEIIESSHCKQNKALLPVFYATVEHTITFRRNVSMKASSKLSKVKEELWSKTASNTELIQRFMSNLDFGEMQERGKLRFFAKLTDRKLTVKMMSVSNLVPRYQKKSLDFSISISVLPFKDAYKVKHSTKIYPNSKEHFFDLCDEDFHMEDETYLTNFVCDQCENQFLQIILYDHSMTRTNKMFRGIFVLPLRELERYKEGIVPGNFTAFPCISKNDANWEIINELRSRASWRTKNIPAQFLKDVDNYIHESRTPVLKT